jgi:uncharacterized protein YdaU (DUF1376 family)
MAKAPTLAMLPWFPRDYLAATRGMTLAERGAYTDLLWFAWDMGTLSNDPKRLARMLGVDADEFAEVWPAIKLKFVQNPDGQLVNERLERERIKAAENKAKALERAKSGGKVTKEKWDKDPEGMAASLAASRAASLATSIAASPIEAGLQARLEEGSPTPTPTPTPTPSPTPTPTPTLGGGSKGEPTRIGLNGSPEEARKAIGALAKKFTQGGSS